MASQEIKELYSGAYSIQFQLMEHERLKKMHEEQYKSIRSARERAHMLSKQTKMRRKALEEKKLAMARAEEERRRKALEERHMKQREATDRFRNAIHRSKTPIKYHFFNDTVPMDAKLVKPVVREDDRKRRQDIIILGQDVEVTRLSHHTPNLDDVLDNIRGRVVQSRSISANTHDIIKPSKDVLPSSLTENNSPIIISPPGSITPTNGRILYPVPPYNSYHNVPINPSLSNRLEELSSSNSSPHDSLESLSPPPSPDEKETPNNLPIQTVKDPILIVLPIAKPGLPFKPVAKPVLPAQPVTLPAQSVTKPVLPAQSVTKPVSPAQPVTIPVSPAQPVTKPVSPAQPTTKTVLPAQPVTKPVLPAQSVTKPVSPAQPVPKPLLEVQPVAKLVQPVEIPVLPIQKLEIATKTSEPVSPQETTPTKEEKKVVSILKKTSDSPHKYMEGIGSTTTTISSSTLSGLSLATSKLSSAKRVRFVDDTQMEEREAEIAINGFSEEFSPSTNASNPKVKISLLNSQGTNTSTEQDTTKTSLDKTPTDDDINALWSRRNGYLHYHKHSNGTDTKVNSTPQLTRRCHNAHQPIKLWRRHGSAQYIEVDQSNGQNMFSVKPSITAMENRLLESIESLNEKLKGRVITMDTYNQVLCSLESASKKSQNRSLTELPRARARHHPKTIIQTTPTPKQHLTNR